MSRQVDGVVTASHTFAVWGGSAGMSVDEMLDELSAEHPDVRLYYVWGIRAAAGAVGLVMVQVSVRVSLASVSEAVAFARGVAHSRFPGVELSGWGVVDSGGVDLVL